MSDMKLIQTVELSKSADKVQSALNEFGLKLYVMELASSTSRIGVA